MSQFLIYFCIDGLNPGKNMLADHWFSYIQSRRRTYIWYQFNLYLWSFEGIIILSLHDIRLKHLLLPARKEPRLYFTPLILAGRPGYFHWYCSIIRRVIANLPSGSSLISIFLTYFTLRNWTCVYYVDFHHWVIVKVHLTLYFYYPWYTLPQDQNHWV